jgi:hypothetical protein
MEVTRHEGKHADSGNSPAQAVKSDTATETDARGRIIKVRRLNALQAYRLSKAIGADSASNEVTMNFATLASSVCEIDGEAVDFPVTERQVEALIQKLDFEGMAAINAGLSKLAGDAEGAIEAAKN